jgi:hypothetical protein
MRWRFIEHRDLDWILATARNMFKESEWKNELEYDTEKIKNYFFSAISNPNVFSMISLDADENPTGFLTGMLMQYNFSDATYAREIDLYVLPSKRGGITAVQMMKKFIEWAKGKGAKEVYFEPSRGVKNNFDAMAKRLDMKSTSTVYRKKL